MTVGYGGKILVIEPQRLFPLRDSAVEFWNVLGCFSVGSQFSTFSQGYKTYAFGGGPSRSAQENVDVYEGVSTMFFSFLFYSFSLAHTSLACDNVENREPPLTRRRNGFLMVSFCRRINSWG